MKTDRLSHRKFEAGDLDRLIEMRLDTDVMKYIGGEKMQNAQSLKMRLQYYIDCYEDRGLGMHAMLWKESGEMIGWSGLQPLEGTDEIEVSYGLVKEYWRMGLGYETALGWLERGFEKVGLDRIVGVAMPENKGSCRILEKLGMKYEKTEEHYNMICSFYAVSKDEFLGGKR